MNIKKSTRRLALTTLVCLCGFFKPGFALELSALNSDVSITVREQPVQQFLQTLFSQVNVPVVVSEEIEGLMNGKFDGNAQKILNDVAKAFNITLYYDGVVAHAYSANEISRTVMPVSGNTAERVEKIASRMGLGDRNNQLDSSGGGGLMVTGTRRFMEQIEELSFSVQANADSTKKAPLAYRVFYLSYAWAADTSFDVGGQSVTVSGVASLLRDLVADGRVPQSLTGQAPTRSNNNSLEGLRGRGMQSVSEQESLGLETPVAATQFAQSSTGARIVADSRLNAVIIRDTADRMTAYQELIDDLDSPSQMVEIEATIIDVNTDKTRELGIAWQYRNSDRSQLDLNTTGDRSDLFAPGSVVQGPGAILSLALGGRDQFLSRIRALEEKGAARVVSKPHVITLSDVEAVLGATTEFFVRVAGDEEVDLFNVPVGTTLRVTPHVFQESGQSLIKLLVNIEDGTASSSQQVDQIPVVERANINTQAVVNEGDSLLIGGLVRDSYKQVASSVPVLGSIPFLGRLFKSTSNQSSRVERLFMITPRTTGGQGFGRSHNGKRALPVLQGDPEDIIASASDRITSSPQPFGKRVDDIPFKPLQLPESQVPLPAPQPAPLAPSSPATRLPGGDAVKPNFQQWTEVPSTTVYTKQEFRNIESPSNSNLPSDAPVSQSQIISTTTNANEVDADGWMIIR